MVVSRNRERGEGVCTRVKDEQNEGAERENSPSSNSRAFVHVYVKAFCNLKSWEGSNN